MTIHVAQWDEICGEISYHNFENKICFFYEEVEEGMSWIIRRRWDEGTMTITEYRSDRQHLGYSVAGSSLKTVQETINGLVAKYEEQ